MERVVNIQLQDYLENRQLISDHQFGLRRVSSAGDLLVYLTHQWAAATKSKEKSLAVSLDIAKAPQMGYALESHMSGA